MTQLPQRCVSRCTAVFVAWIASAISIGQTPSSAPPSSNDSVIRLTVNLVQVDAVVTDSKGHHIPDLTADDFEILQDGKPQKITHFAYFSTGTVRPTPDPVLAGKNAPAVPSRLQREQVRRTIAIVVDDLGLSWDSMTFVREALKKFADRIEPGDMVAILHTSSGVGLLQSFTNDRRQILAAIDRIDIAIGRGGVSASTPRGGGGLNGFRDEFFTVGSLGSLRYVIEGLRELPGRKSVIFISDGFRTTETKINRGKTVPGLSTTILDPMQKLVDIANRASVVLYTLDARGLATIGFDVTRGRPPSPGALGAVSAIYSGSQDGMNYIAEQTGGLFFHDNNDLAGSLGKILDDQAAYYLLGYSPGEETFHRDLHKIDVRVKRQDLSVRSRKEFYGVPDEAPRPAPKTRAEQMLSAITSPFGSSAIGVRLTGLFTNEGKQGSCVTSMLHIDARDLTFVPEPSGTQKAVVEILLMTFGDYGLPVDHSSHAFTVHIKPQDYARTLRDGITFKAQHPVKKPGAYQLRAAVRDATTEHVGSASQFIEIPDVSKGNLTLSGILLQRKTLELGKGAEGAAMEDDPQGTPAVRVFHAGEEFVYASQILNAKLDRGSKQPHLDFQVRLFRAGKLFFESVPVNVPGGRGDGKNFLAGGTMQLRAGFPPGSYVLQVIATDHLAKEKRAIATQWIDFEVAKEVRDN